MKKMLIAAALIACVATVKASAVSWGATTALDTEKFSAGTFYLVGANDISAIDLTKLDGQATLSYDTLVSAGFDRLYSSFNYASTTTSINSDKFNASDLGYAAGTVQAYEILIADDGKALAYSKTSFALNNATSPAQSKKLVASSFTVVDASAIPEPTSGLLLLLGMAGLALKRKHA